MRYSGTYIFFADWILQNMINVKCLSGLCEIFRKDLSRFDKSKYCGFVKQCFCMTFHLQHGEDVLGLFQPVAVSCLHSVEQQVGNQQ